MVEVTRRQTLALGAGAFLTDLLAAGAVRAGAKDTLTIAYNVNLPSFDPTDGTSAVNPTIQAIYRSIFRSIYRAGARPCAQARDSHRLGLERRQDETLDGRSS